jgi:hypothetical protein
MIGNWAFQGCTSLASVTILAIEADFRLDVFGETPSDLTIFGFEGSTSQTYAEANGHNFVPISKPCDCGDCAGFGDVDGDGVIDSADVTLLRRYIAAKDNLSEGALADWVIENGFVAANADVNGNGVINAADVTLLRRYIAAYNKADVKLGQGINTIT